MKKPKIPREANEGLIGSSIVITHAQHAGICDLIGCTTAEGYEFRSFSQVVRYMVERTLRELASQHNARCKYRIEH